MDDWDIEGFWNNNKKTSNTENSEKITEAKQSDSERKK